MLTPLVFAAAFVEHWAELCGLPPLLEELPVEPEEPEVLPSWELLLPPQAAIANRKIERRRLPGRDRCWLARPREEIELGCIRHSEAGQNFRMASLRTRSKSMLTDVARLLELTLMFHVKHDYQVR